MIGDLTEAVIHTRGDNHDVARADHPARGRLDERRVVAGTDHGRDELAISRDRLDVLDLAAGDEGARPRDDVVDLGDLRVVDGAQRRAGLGGTPPQHGDADVELAHIEDLDLAIAAAGRGYHSFDLRGRHHGRVERLARLRIGWRDPRRK